MKIEVRYGILIGLLWLLWQMLVFMAGFHDTLIQYHIVSSIIGFLPVMWCIHRGIKERKHARTNFAFGKAFITGLIITGIGIVAVLPAEYLYVTALNPDYFMNMIDFDAHLITSKSLPIEKAREMVSPHYGLFSHLFSTGLNVFIVGILFSAVSGFLQREKHTARQ